MVQIVREGLAAYAPGTAVYIRPMYWALDGGDLGIVPKAGATGFAICLEAIPMAAAGTATTLTTTRFRRPVLEDNVVNAKAGCLYPNNARMLAEARVQGLRQRPGRRRDGQRRRNRDAPTSSWCATARCSRRSPTAPSWPGSPGRATWPTCAPTGYEVHETVLTFDDFRARGRGVPVGQHDEGDAGHGLRRPPLSTGPVTRAVREMYWDWARPRRSVHRCTPVRRSDRMPAARRGPTCASSSSFWTTAASA